MNDPGYADLHPAARKMDQGSIDPAQPNVEALVGTHEQQRIDRLTPMKNKAYLRNLSNSFLDVHLASLASWKKANEIFPRDRNGPYVILQEGYDPEDLSMTPNEFVLGRSGKWLALAYFFRMPVPERRAEFVFGTAGEVMEMMGNLPSKAQIIRPGATPESAPATPENDEMATALRAARGESSTAKR